MSKNPARSCRCENVFKNRRLKPIVRSQVERLPPQPDTLDSKDWIADATPSLQP
jgi:hypothetical protein